MRSRIVVTWTLLLAAGCSASPPPPPRAAERAPAPAASAPVPPGERFAEALAELAAHDAASDWSDAACADLTARFLAVFDPPRAESLYNAAVVEARCGEDDAALDHAGQAAALDPRSAPARILLAHLTALSDLARRDFAGARRRVAAAVEQDGPDELLLGDMAQIHVIEVITTDRPEAAAIDLAREACDRAIQRTPSSPRLHELRGALAMKDRRYADARADFERAIALDPHARAAKYGEASIAAESRDYGAAEDGYKGALASDPNSFDVRLERAIALRAAIDTTAAEDDFEERYRAARDAVAAAIAVAPERPEGHYHFAVLLLDHGSRRRKTGAETAMHLAYDVLGKVISMEETDSDRSSKRRAVYARARLLYTDLTNMLFCRFNVTEKQRKEEEARRRQLEIEAEAEEKPVPP